MMALSIFWQITDMLRLPVSSSSNLMILLVRFSFDFATAL